MAATRAEVEQVAEGEASIAAEVYRVPDKPLKSYKRRLPAPSSPSHPTKLRRLRKLGGDDPAPERVPSHLEDDDVPPPPPLTDFPAADVEGSEDGDHGNEQEVESAPPVCTDKGKSVVLPDEDH